MIETIKMLTLRALVSDESLMYGLVLKGGNALQLAYGMTVVRQWILTSRYQVILLRMKLEG